LTKLNVKFMAWCLIKSDADKFKSMLISGEISPVKLNAMTSAGRRAFFATHFGLDNAKRINTLFESKLLLKNQKAGMISWAKNIMKDAPTQIDKSIMNKINKLDKVLNEKELNTFLEDLVEQKTGFQVSEDEFKQLAELGKNAQNKKNIALDKMENGKWVSEADKDKYGIDFGASKVAFDNYYSQLAELAKGKSWDNIKETFKNKGVLPGLWTGFTTSFDAIASNSRVLKATYDNSFFGRQGRKAISRPATSKLWLNRFTQSFVDAKDILIKGKIKGDEIMNATKAEIYSRENYLNGRYETGKKLAIGIREEEFPTSFPTKIPALGRLIKTSEVIYEGGATRLRADIADKFFEMAENQNINLKDKVEVGEINEQANIMTGRGTLRGVEEVGEEIINKAFFSAKFALSQIQSVSKLGTAKTKFAREQARKTLLSNILSSGLVILMVAFLWRDRVELDPRSTNFGKVKIGNIWVDITGGLASYFILFARIIANSTKNTYTGIIQQSGEGYGSDDSLDKIFDFLQNKTSPIASVIKDMIKRKTFDGDRPTIFNETLELITPIIGQEASDSYQTKKQVSDMLLAVVADGLGASVSSYVFQENWSQKTTKELLKFKEKVGDKEFKKANKEYERQVSDMYIKLFFDQEYQKLNNDERQKEITKRKDKIKKGIL